VLSKVKIGNEAIVSNQKSRFATGSRRHWKVPAACCLPLILARVIRTTIHEGITCAVIHVAGVVGATRFIICPAVYYSTIRFIGSFITNIVEFR